MANAVLAPVPLVISATRRSGARASACGHTGTRRPTAPRLDRTPAQGLLRAIGSAHSGRPEPLPQRNTSCCKDVPSIDSPIDGLHAGFGLVSPLGLKSWSSPHLPEALCQRLPSDAGPQPRLRPVALGRRELGHECLFRVGQRRPATRPRHRKADPQLEPPSSGRPRQAVDDPKETSGLPISFP